VFWGPGDYHRIRPLGENVKIFKVDVPCRPCRQYVHEDRCERGENVCLRMIRPGEVIGYILKVVGASGDG